MTPRRAQHAHMTRLLKPRGNGRTKLSNAPQPLDWKWLMSVCRPSESPMSPIIKWTPGNGQ